MVKFLATLYVVFLPKVWKNCTAFCSHKLSSPTGWTELPLNGKQMKSFPLDSFVSVAEPAAVVSMLYFQFFESTFSPIGENN